MATYNQTPAGGTIPTTYTRGNSPSDPTGYPRYLDRELAKIETSIRTLINLTPQSAAKAPSDPIEGMMRLAKAPWRPVSGQTTDKWVTYVNGAWVYLSSS